MIGLKLQDQRDQLIWEIQMNTGEIVRQPSESFTSLWCLSIFSPEIQPQWLSSSSRIKSKLFIMTWTWASPNDFSVPISYLLHDVLALPVFFHLKRPSLSLGICTCFSLWNGRFFPQVFTWLPLLTIPVLTKTSPSQRGHFPNDHRPLPFQFFHCTY